MLTPAAAQQATQAQRDAVRAACRSDFMANCGGIQPGGKEAFECLVSNEAKLSGPCRNAVSAIANPSSGPAASVPTAASPASVPDQASPSPQHQPSPASVTPGTKSSRSTATGTQKTPATVRTTTLPGTAAAPSDATVAPLGPIRPMLPRRALMILAQCRPDQQKLCAGVPAGGGKILDCLAANAQQLSPVCYDALAGVSE
jgi:hypothetical protein